MSNCNTELIVDLMKVVNLEFADLKCMVFNAKLNQLVYFKNKSHFM